MKTMRVLLLLVALAAGCASPAPSPSPSPTSVQSEPNAALVAFEGHLTESISREGQLVRQLATASAGTNAELRAVAGLMAAWATDELAWLDANPAESCFAEAADAYRSGVGDIAASAAAFEELAAAPSPPSDAEGQAAGARLASGTESIEQAAALARSARAVCR
jgi:hypothetical protein